MKKIIIKGIAYLTSRSEIIKVGVVTIDVSSIGTKIENFVQAGCMDLGSHRGRTVYCRKPIFLPEVVLFFGKFLELPVPPSIICDLYDKTYLLEPSQSKDMQEGVLVMNLIYRIGIEQEG